MHLPAIEGVRESPTLQVSYNPLLPASYDILWTLVVMIAVAVLLVVVVGLVLLLVRARRRDRGTAPTTSGAAPLSERLAELDRLHDEGAISSEEHRQARARVLGTL